MKHSFKSLTLVIINEYSWIFIERTDAEAETPILWPPDVKNWLIGKDPDAGKDWRQEEETTEDEMVGLHHWLDGHEFEQTLGDGEGQESLACCSPWDLEELDMTEQLSKSNTPILLGNRQFVFQVCESNSVFQISSFVSYFRFHI